MDTNFHLVIKNPFSKELIIVHFHTKIENESAIDVPQITLGFSLILPLFRSSNKAEPVRMAADPSDFGSPHRSMLKDAGLAFIQPTFPG
jgi:hypothetical protein